MNQRLILTPKLVWVFILFLSVSCSKKYHTILRVPTIYDGEKYGRKPAGESKEKIKLEKSTNSFKLPELKQWYTSRKAKKYENNQDFFEKTTTNAFVVIKEGNIIYENYFNGSSASDINQLFSVSKNLTVSMLGWALKDGFIQSVEQTVGEFLPQTEGTDIGKIQLKHLANMTSGINHNEYRRFLKTLKFYYLKESDNVCELVKLKHLPGKKFAYKSVDTQILGMCIENATLKSLTDYFYEKIWQHIGAEHPAYWSVDSKLCNIPKYYGGFNCSAVDIAKFGLIYLNEGSWDGKQLVPEDWTKICLNEENRFDETFKYCYSWWGDVDDPYNRAYYGAGFGGQILYINREKGIVIVRLGEKKGKGSVDWYKYIDQLAQIIN